jgi:hypothetical protein
VLAAPAADIAPVALGYHGCFGTLSGWPSRQPPDLGGKQGRGRADHLRDWRLLTAANELQHSEEWLRRQFATTATRKRRC